MNLLVFFLGLAFGIGFCYWQQNRFARQLRQILDLLPNGNGEISLPLISQLRRGIVLFKQQRLDLETEIGSWQQLLLTAPIGYLQVDEENQLLWCNQQAQQLLQIQRWEPGQLRLLLEIVRSYELDQLIQETRDRQQPSKREWVFHPAFADAVAIGGARAIALRASSWPLNRGQVGVFLENRQPLVELSQSRDRWVSDLAHELRTPLTSIHLVAETLQSRLQPPLSRWANQLLQETNRLINLVQNLLDLSRMDSTASQPLNYKSVELKGLIDSVWQTLEPLAQQKQLNLTYSGNDAIAVRAEESRLHRVFLNLFDNSIKYSPPGASILVEINLIGNTAIQINVIDSGSGFPETDLPHVFDRLYRGDPARARQFSSTNLENSGDSAPSNRISISQLPINNGNGLGLSIVQQIVFAHGGTIQAKNHPQTGGAWLQIELPL